VGGGAAVTGAVAVRVATVGDVDALVDLRRRWTEERALATPAAAPTVDPGFAARFRAWFDDEARHRTFWLAEAGARAIGMVNLFTFRRMPQPGRAGSGWGYLGNMYVIPEHRDAGVGRYLLDALVAHADAAGLERVVLSPAEQSVPFYRRAGFDPADQLLLRPHPGTPHPPRAVSPV
jgi:GNAT superfamily N-acetyltransferase